MEKKYHLQHLGISFLKFITENGSGSAELSVKIHIGPFKCFGLTISMFVMLGTSQSFSKLFSFLRRRPVQQFCKQQFRIHLGWTPFQSKSEYHIQAPAK